MFSQASVCPSPGGEVLHQMHNGIGHMVRGGEWTAPPSPPLGPGHNTSLPPSGPRSQHLPPWTTALPAPLWAQVTTPPPPPSSGPRSQHLPPPLWAQVTTPPPLDNSTSLPLDNSTSLPPWTTAPPSPPLWSMGRQYASYWNAFLFFDLCRQM